MGELPTTERRAQLLREIGPQGLLILFAGREVIRNNDVPHPFRQDSDFYYLTGLEEPDAVLVLLGGSSPVSVLFLRPRDPDRAIWDGPRLGVEGAVEKLGVDRALPIGALSAELPELMLGKTKVYCRLTESVVEQRVMDALAIARQKARRRRGYPTCLVDAELLIHEMRRIKSASEVSRMARAAEVSVAAHRVAMAQAAPGRFEYEIDAAMSNVFRRAGCDRPAYGSIVASGSMATTLHYIDNRRQMKDGELLLIDAGCELNYYASDITRTFPVGGKFSSAQREVYDLVLEAQYAAINCCTVGQTMEGIHAAAVDVIARGLLRLGVLTGSLDEVLEKETYKAYFMHKTGHYLGMDVHDVGTYFVNDKPRPLEQGVVLTVEPGLYFSESAPDQAARYRGIGVRIEDDLAIATGGAEELTAALPKEADEVERLCCS